jgi:glucose dehydrogenase
MAMRLYRLVISMTVFCGFLAGAQGQKPGSVPVSTSIQVSSENLAAQPVGANWLSYNGDYTGRRFSSLVQITPKNVSFSAMMRSPSKPWTHKRGSHCGISTPDRVCMHRR